MTKLTYEELEAIKSAFMDMVVNGVGCTELLPDGSVKYIPYVELSNSLEAGND